jgi:hypothetical protein
MFLHATWLGTERTLQQVQRLHIIHSDHFGEPTYQDLITRSCWDRLVGNGGPVYFDPYALLKENAQLGDIAKNLVKLCPSQPMMPRLERIVMGGFVMDQLPAGIQPTMLQSRTRSGPHQSTDGSTLLPINPSWSTFPSPRSTRR